MTMKPKWKMAMVPLLFAAAAGNARSASTQAHGSGHIIEALGSWFPIR